MFIHNSSWHLLRLLYKVSTPGDRTWIASRLPETLTWLEMRMPITWNTAVIHILLCCITKQMEAVGPLHSANLLDIERFQTVFKGLARGTADVMESILNHYVLLETTLSNRLTSIWTGPTQLCQAPLLATSRVLTAPIERTHSAAVLGLQLPTCSSAMSKNRCRPCGPMNTLTTILYIASSTLPDAAPDVHVNAHPFHCGSMHP